MISITRLLGGSKYFGDDLLFAPEAKSGTAPVVIWAATRTCNLDCINCYAEAERKKFPGELTTKEAKEMIDDLASFGVSALVISGGEPLVRSDIMEIAEHATSKGVTISFSTNGTLIDSKTASEMKRIGVAWVTISIDGSEETHDRLRNRKGAYREALAGIRACRAAGVRVDLRFTPTGGNADDLGDVFRLVEKEEIGRLCVHHLVYSAHGPIEKSLDLTAAEARFVMDAIIDQADRWNREGRDIEVLTVDNDADAPYVYYRLMQKDPARAQRALDLIKECQGNCSCSGVAAIDSVGNVHPDQFTRHYTIGSVRERPFSYIWTNTDDKLVKAMRDRRFLLKGRCSTCMWVGVCNGNFRTRAEAATGDFWETDPACYLTDNEVAPLNAE